jgi:hypothetical protein
MGQKDQEGKIFLYLSYFFLKLQRRKLLVSNKQYFQGRGTVPPSTPEGVEQNKNKAEKVLRREVHLQRAQ